jgi:hypothetical protein
VAYYKELIRDLLDRDEGQWGPELYVSYLLILNYDAHILYKIILLSASLSVSVSILQILSYILAAETDILLAMFHLVFFHTQSHYIS